MFNVISQVEKKIVEKYIIRRCIVICRFVRFNLYSRSTEWKQILATKLYIRVALNFVQRMNYVDTSEKQVTCLPDSSLASCWTKMYGKTMALDSTQI